MNFRILAESLDLGWAGLLLALIPLIALVLIVPGYYLGKKLPRSKRSPMIVLIVGVPAMYLLTAGFGWLFLGGVLAGYYKAGRLKIR